MKGNNIPRTYSRRWLTRKRGTRRQRGKRFPVFKPKPRKRTRFVSILSRLELKQQVYDFVQKYKKTAGLKEQVQIKFDKRGQKLADTRYSSQRKIHEIHINLKHLEELYELDPKVARKFLEYGVAHETGHMQQIEEHGVRAFANTPRFYLELDADKRAEKLSGMKKKEIDEIISQLEKKYRKKQNIKPKPPPSIKAPRLIIKGKKAVRVLGWESGVHKEKMVLPSRNVTEQRLVPKSAKSVWVIEFDKEGTPIPKSSKHIPRNQLDKYHLVS